MEFLDNLVLPQSSEHIELLHYLLMMILFLFMPFIGAIFGGSLLSVFFRKKGLEEGNAQYLRFAKDIIELVTINKATGIILGIIPVLTSMFIYAQLLHNTNSMVVGLIAVSFLPITIGLILIYTFRYTLSFSQIFDSVRHINTQDDVTAEIRSFRESNKHLSTRSGRWGLILLFFAIWMFNAALSLSVDTVSWNDNPIAAVFYIEVIVNLLTFIAAAFAITGGAIFLGYFYWEGGRKDLSGEYKAFIKSTALRVTFVSSLLIPLLLLINFFLLPVASLSGSVFIYAFVALFFLFLAYHFLYAMVRDDNVKYSGHVFFVILFAFLAIIVKDQLAMNNATQVQKVILADKFDQYLSSLKGESGTVEISGKEIFEVRCASCHRFDQKLVGPPYNEILPKYEGNTDQLVSFIMNPVKVNPAYPPMPSPGLKPNEAKAVATYLIEEYKNK